MVASWIKKKHVFRNGLAHGVYCIEYGRACELRGLSTSSACQSCCAVFWFDSLSCVCKKSVFRVASLGVILFPRGMGGGLSGISVLCCISRVRHGCDSSCGFVIDDV